MYTQNNKMKKMLSNKQKRKCIKKETKLLFVFKTKQKKSYEINEIV